MTQIHQHFFLLFILFIVFVKIDALDINRSNNKFSQQSSKSSDLHNIPYGAFISLPSYLLSQKLFGIISYSNSGNSRETTKLVYSYHTESSNFANKPNDVILDHLDSQNSFIYIPNTILSSFGEGCEVEGNYHIIKNLINKCEEVNEFVNSTINDYTPDLIQYNATHIITDDTSIEVMPHSSEEVDHLLKTMNYDFYPMKCDSCSGIIDNTYMVLLDDKIISVTMNSEKDYEINNEMMKISSINSITNIKNHNLYCTMLDEEDTVIYCIKSDEKKDNIIEIILTGKTLKIESKSHVVDEYIKYIHEITHNTIKYFQNISSTTAKRYLYEKKNQKDITINTYPLMSEKSSFIDSKDNDKYVVVNGRNIMKLESIEKVDSSNNYTMINYHIELDTDYLKNEGSYSVLDGDIYYFMMSKDENIYYKSNIPPTGSINYDELIKSKFEDEKIIIQKSIDSINEMVNEVTLSVEQYNIRYGIANIEEENGNIILVIYTGNDEYVEMYNVENNLFKLVYKLDKIEEVKNKYNVERLNEDKSQIKFASNSPYIKKCNNAFDSSKSYSIKEIKEICPTIIESFVNKNMNLKLPFTLELTVKINEDKHIIKKLIIERTNEKTVERLLNDENRIELIENIINTSLQTTKINLANKYEMKNDVNKLIYYLSSKYVMSINYDSYCSVYIDKINKTLLRNEITTFVVSKDDKDNNNKENYNCFNFKDNEKYVYCLKYSMKNDFLDISSILDDKLFDHFIRRENDKEIRIDEVKELRDCYVNIKKIIQNEIEKEKEINEKYEEILLKNNMMNKEKMIKTNDVENKNEEEDGDKLVEVYGIYESNNNNGYYKGLYISNTHLYHTIKINRNTLQISYDISIIRNEEVYKIKILNIDEKNTGLYNENNEFKQIQVNDIPTQFTELLMPIAVGKEYEMKISDKHYILQIKDSLSVDLIKCNEDNVKSILKLVVLPTKPVTKPFHNEFSYNNNILNVFYSKGFYLTTEERDNYYYKNSIQLNNDDKTENYNGNTTYTKFCDDYYVFDINNNKIYSSNSDYIQYFNYINNVYIPSIYSDKLTILKDSLTYIQNITKPIQYVIDNLIEPEVMNYTQPDDNNNDNDGGDGDNGKGKYKFSTMEILAIVFGSLFVVIVIGITVWSCINCYKDKQALKEIELEEMNRIYREKNGFTPSTNKEFIKIQMMPKV